MNFAVWILLLMSFGLAPLRALANADEKLLPDFFFDTQFGLTTSKSKLVLSNDTGTALRYGFGTNAGSDSKLALMLHFDHDATTFALNDSKIDMTWQDTRVRYHMGFFYLGALFTRLEMKVDQAGAPFIDAAGSGMGANTGLLFGFGKGGSFYLDIQTASLTNMKNSLAQTVSVSQRLDLDLGASFDLTAKLLDLCFGYRTRQLTVVTDTAYKEALTSTYVGLRLALSL